MTNARSRLWARLAGAGLLLVLGACGDSTSPTTPPTPAPPTPVPPTAPPASLVIEGQQLLTAPTGKGSTFGNWDFTLPVSGSVQVTISYLYDTSHVLVWVTDRACNQWQFQRDECFYLTKSLDGSRPRTLTATGVKAGTYSLFVANDGPNDETVGYRVTLLPGSNGEGRLTTGTSAKPPAP